MDPYAAESRTHQAVPIAIIIGFAMIALAIFFVGRNDNEPTQPVVSEEGEIIQGTIRPVDETDYIKGNPNAPILMIEYSDYDCPFCKDYHATLNRIMNEYGITGKVAWVYRQFPLEQLHPNAPKISQAALCVGELGGSNAFWKFTDSVFSSRESGDQTNMVLLPEYASTAGIDKNAFQSCLSSEKMKSTVEASMKEAFDLGARGTPYTVLVVGNEQAVINGAQSYDVVKSVIDNLISQLGGLTTQTAPAATTTQ